MTDKDLYAMFINSNIQKIKECEYLLTITKGLELRNLIKSGRDKAMLYLEMNYIAYGFTEGQSKVKVDHLLSLLQVVGPFKKLGNKFCYGMTFSAVQMWYIYDKGKLEGKHE